MLKKKKKKNSCGLQMQRKRRKKKMKQDQQENTHSERKGCREVQILPDVNLRRQNLSKLKSKQKISKNKSFSKQFSSPKTFKT